jgi:hypothetical protein
MRPPGRGDFSFEDFSHAPSPKNLSKNGFCPRKGVAFLKKALLQKNFQVRERMSSLAFVCRLRACRERPQPQHRPGVGFSWGINGPLVRKFAYQL